MPEIALKSDDVRKLVQEILAKGGTIRLPARGRSMEPLIADGDSVIVGPVEPSGLKEGMILLYHPDKTCALAHRLVRVEAAADDREPGLVVRGDALACRDERIGKRQVLGHVIAIERNGQTRRLDRGRLWLAGRMWARSRLWGLALVSPLMCARTATGSALLWVQGFTLYRRLASLLLGKRVTYSVSTNADEQMLGTLRSHTAGPRTVVTRSGRVSPARETSCSSDCTVVAVLGEHVVGTLVMRYDFLDVGSDMGWWIVDLIVRVPFRRMGIATQLLDLAFDKAASAGVPALNVLVEPGNRQVHDFWSCMGFQPCAIPGFYGPVEDESRGDKGRWVVMSKPVIDCFSQREHEAGPA